MYTEHEMVQSGAYLQDSFGLRGPKPSPL